MNEFYDEQLGRIVVKPHPRAVQFIARRKEGYIQLTVPRTASKKEVRDVIRELAPRLLAIKSPTSKPFVEGTRLTTFAFDVQIRKTAEVSELSYQLKNSVLTIFIPMEHPVEDDETQERIRITILNLLRREARRILPRKTAFFAERFGMSYERVKITSSRSRWGSCSGRKNINLSYFLLFLPEPYIDYVVLHELAHTREMNHGPNFWKLLSAMCGEDAKTISKRLKQLPLENLSYFPSS